MTPFAERAHDMGLNTELASKGLFSYTDRYSQVIYRQAATIDPHEDDYPHDTDGIVLPKLAIFTKPVDVQVGQEVKYQYCGMVSDLYKFIGNDTLNERIRQAITSIGMPILAENPIFNYQLTSMRNEVVIQSSQHAANVGDVLPVMIVNNSYDGTRAATVAFGITTEYREKKVTFAFNLGEMRQVHIENSDTSVTSAIASYMQAFSESIADMIDQSFRSTLTEDEMLATLDVIENLGKKRREGVSKLLQEMLPDVVEGQPIPLPSAWQVFLAIVRYSSYEPNLNIKRMMENAAESVLVIPQRMYEVLEKLPVS